MFKKCFFSLSFFMCLSIQPIYAVQEILAKIPDIHPTQTDIGMAHVLFSVDKIKSKDSDIVKAIQTRVLPCVIGPDGKYYITDGHHWATASASLLKDHPELSEKIFLKLNVLSDFRKKSWKDFANYLYDNRIGYFNKTIRAPYEVAGPNGTRIIPREVYLELIKKFFPKSLLETADSPMRALVGIAFEEMGIVAEHSLIDYIEFYVAELLGDRIKELKIDLEKIRTTKKISAVDMRKMKKFLAGDLPTLRYLFSSLRPGLCPGDCRDHLVEKINKYRIDTLKNTPLPSEFYCAFAACAQ